MGCFVCFSGPQLREQTRGTVAGDAGSPVDGGAQASAPRQGAKERPDVHVYKGL